MNYLISAYGIIWFVVFGHFFMMQKQNRRIEKKIASLDEKQQD